MVTLHWEQSFRIVFSRYPFVGIFDFIADPADLDEVVALEARTNDRILDELGNLALVRPRDRIAGPGTTPIMASFTHARPSRFSDGSYGAYYAGKYFDVALAESRFHVEQFYRATAEESADIDVRVYRARIDGAFDDLRKGPMSDPRFDPGSYVESQRYGRCVYDADVADGIAYPSVRDPRHRSSVACFRPRAVSSCYSWAYLSFRWDAFAGRIVDVVKRETLSNPL